MFVFYKVVVEMNVMVPHLSVISEADLGPVVDVVSNGVVVDHIAVRGVKGAFWVEGSVDQDFARLRELCESGRQG